jgi:hypothetical protein
MRLEQFGDRNVQGGSDRLGYRDARFRDVRPASHAARRRAREKYKLEQRGDQTADISVPLWIVLGPVLVTRHQ